MQEDLCELRFDVALPLDADARGFEQAWRATLSGRKISAKAVAARFRLFAPDLEGERRSAWHCYLTARLAALPGGPTVADAAKGPADAAKGPADAAPAWRGVKIWLAYPARDLPALLKRSARKTRRGCRP